MTSVTHSAEMGNQGLSVGTMSPMHAASAYPQVNAELARVAHLARDQMMARGHRSSLSARSWRVSTYESTRARIGICHDPVQSEEGITSHEAF